MTDTASTAYSSIERSTVIRSGPEPIVDVLADFTRWPEWSPWEGTDAETKRTYAGTQGSVGAHYTWEGNRKAGAGSMVVTRMTPGTVEVDLTFSRPFKASNRVIFDLTPVADASSDGATKVVWTMLSPKTTRSRLMGIFLNIDKLVGGDFDKGLVALKALVERH
ncbi:SRPBCC family protein [Frondihabitans sp. Leaf304]|uniref:SRPBCC family protein n=1 Tax=Frondihabitans sp. Leaf304 TaxID=1736329 RepID=UPI0006F54C83|nr:SRPBCC family protein [Frondihabitans sp. Leaf304]KQQ27305.1 hypothetical protein ASF54_00290 [Frondihabitans sp. Leaf304]